MPGAREEEKFASARGSCSKLFTMLKLLKVLGYVLGGLVALLAIAAVTVYAVSSSKLKAKHEVALKATSVMANADAIRRGEHLAKTRGCVDCHGADLGGAKVIDDPAMGRLYGPNLTRGRGGVGSDYSDVDFERAIRHGVAKDGRGLFLMPSTDFAHFTERDMSDLIAYLKSVPEVDRERVPLSVGPVARVLLSLGKIKISANEIDHAASPAVVTPGVTVEYGRYLAISCTGCHGANFSGGKIDIGPPDWPHAANLTPDASGRLKDWSEADFIAALRTGKRPDGSVLSPVMPAALSGLNDVEMKAMWMFLKTLPPLPTGTR
jgi:cytochrome c553